MSEIAEQEAREAAAFIADIGNGSNDHAPKLLAALMMNILSRRDAERAEREKPITAEWLESIDAMKSGLWYVFDIGVQVGLRVNIHGWIVTVNHRMLDIEYSDRGQLLDLLWALKGGGT